MPVSCLELDGLPAPDSYRAGELVALDDALITLTQLDPRRASVVELRVFGGLTGGGNGPGARSLAAERHARLEIGKSVAASRAVEPVHNF